MECEIREYQEEDIPGITKIWNEITEAGNAFPGEELYSEEEMKRFLAGQTKAACARIAGKVAGFYILHPNNIGRCSHIANASYGVSGDFRRQGVGERLVRHSLEMTKKCGFKGLQFNAVVSDNRRAIALYQKCGFRELGRVKDGFRLKDGSYIDTILFFHEV